jgi:hypothetical protein
MRSAAGLVYVAMKQCHGSIKLSNTLQSKSLCIHDLLAAIAVDMSLCSKLISLAALEVPTMLEFLLLSIAAICNF